MRANTTITPATIATATPLPSDFAFSAISVFASSISSRTSSDAFVETSLTTSPSDLSAVPLVLLIVAAPQLLQELGEDESAYEGSDDGDLRTTGIGRRGDVSLPWGLRLAVCGCACFHHSGGSSSKSLTQIAAAKRVVAIVASAPRPASRPLQTRRFTSSFCMSARTLTGDGGSLSARNLYPSTDRFDHQRLRLLEVL